MLLGEFEQRLDDKNRVTLPARLRSAFETGAVCARGLDGCVVVYPRDSWEAYVSAHSAVRFSHGVCPECLKSVVEPEMDEFRRALREKTEP